ncbi:MAG TPA: HNH endonuclease [Blastocatellia bacterium]|jgi:putative restriction endonuclease
MTDGLQYYLRKIETLRIGRAHNAPAPHKPLLLLAVLDLIEAGDIHTNRIEPSPRLVETFLKYWKHIGTGHARVFLPFYHLKTSGFWHLHPHKGKEVVLGSVRAFNAMSQLATTVSYASFDDELFALLLDPESREYVRRTIIDTHLPYHRPVVEAVINENREVSNVERKLLRRAEKASAVDDVPESPIRSAAFRSAIMKLYDYTCAACRLRIITLDGGSAVDAAHIIPFSVSHDDGIGNGLALCKTHHWAFDSGLLSLDDRYKLLVSGAFDETGPAALLLRNLKENPILLPPQKPFHPALHAVRWHRANRFQS